MNPPHNTPVKYMTFICKLGAPVIPRCQQVLAEKRILMKYLLLAGRSIITYYYTVLFSTKGVNSSFNVACSPLTNLFKKGAAKELLCFFFPFLQQRDGAESSGGGSGRIWCDASGGTEESSGCRNESWGHDTLQTQQMLLLLRYCTKITLM